MRCATCATTDWRSTSTPFARRAGAAPKTIYNHPDLPELIRAQSTRPAPAYTAPTTTTDESSVLTALRQQPRVVAAAGSNRTYNSGGNKALRIWPLGDI